MDLPKETKVGCFTYSITAIDLDVDNKHGDTCFSRRAIRIDFKDPDQNQKETLLHEVLHTLLEDCAPMKLNYKDPLEREEDIIRFLSPRLLIWLRDNPEVLEYLK